MTTVFIGMSLVTQDVLIDAVGSVNAGIFKSELSNATLLQYYLMRQLT